MTTRIALVGYGNLGSALLEAWLHTRKENTEYFIISAREEVFTNPHVHYIPSENTDALDVDTVVFCVKPQKLASILPTYKERISTNTLLISTAAGKNMSFYERYFPYNPWVRAMPNTAVRVMKSFTGLLGNQYVRQEHMQRTENLFGAIGKMGWLSSDRQMGHLTALIGSGPAYLFYWVECMEDIAIDLGFDADIARNMVFALMDGTNGLLQHMDESPAILREQVMSPGGTTEAALSVMMDENGLIKVLHDSVHQAIQRSEELAEG